MFTEIIVFMIVPPAVIHCADKLFLFVFAMSKYVCPSGRKNRRNCSDK